MSIAQLLAWMQIAQTATAAGIATAETIKGWIGSLHGKQLTEAELNVVLATVLDDATRRRALALKDAAGA